VSGTWTENNAIAPTSDTLYGITGIVSGTSVTLYATGSGANNDAGTLYALTDSSGYNGLMSGSLSTVATAAPNEAFRGVALAPELPAFVPPDKNSNSCEDKIARSLSTLSLCMVKCQVSQADAALKSKMFDEVACEQGAGKPVSCRATYNKASALLLGAKKPTCPLCMDQTRQSNLADAVQSFFNNNTGLLYCDGTVAFGGGPGFVPPNKTSGGCEDKVAGNLKKFAGCLIKCQTSEADATAKGKVFDVNACEAGVGGRTLSCRGTYNKANGLLLNAKKPTCPTCMTAALQSSLADAVTDFVHQNKGEIYCDGTVPLP